MFRHNRKHFGLKETRGTHLRRLTQGISFDFYGHRITSSMINTDYRHTTIITATLKILKIHIFSTYGQLKTYPCILFWYLHFQAPLVENSLSLGCSTSGLVGLVIPYSLQCSLCTPDGRSYLVCTWGSYINMSGLAHGTKRLPLNRKEDTLVLDTKRWPHIHGKWILFISFVASIHLVELHHEKVYWIEFNNNKYILESSEDNGVLHLKESCFWTLSII
jgi:hypothetical protein